VCGQAVLDALCQSLGFDQAWDGMEATITNRTSPQEAVRSLTGEVRKLVAWAAHKRRVQRGWLPAQGLMYLLPAAAWRGTCMPTYCLLGSPASQYCLREGVYSPIVPPDLESMPGALCSKIDGITCVRCAGVELLWLAREWTGQAGGVWWPGSRAGGGLKKSP
jgi:hypothetical protein